MEIQALRVLLIEDDSDHAELVQGCLDILRDQPVTWTWVDTLAKGIALLHDERVFDVVILDLSLPDSSLSETVLRLRPHAEGTPIVVLTSLNDMDVALRAVREGAQDYLVKTQLSSELLLRTIRHAVERSRHMAELARMNETLEQRVAERTRDLERALAKPEVRFTDKYLEASYTYWNTLLTVEGLLLTFFSVDVVGDPDAGLYAYGLVGWWSAWRGRRDFDDALRPLQTKLAIGLTGLALLLALPIVDFGAISARSQVARLESGRIEPAQFDWAAMAFDFGPAGRKRLADLARSGPSQWRELAQDALKSKERWGLAEATRAATEADDVAKRIRLLSPDVRTEARRGDLDRLRATAFGGARWYPSTVRAVVRLQT